MIELKECITCGHIKKSNPTPDGDETCPKCWGDCMDYEPDKPNYELPFMKETFTQLDSLMSKAKEITKKYSKI